MCGIIAVCGEDNAQDILIKGLEFLEYRGYDSAGIALVEDKGFRVITLLESDARGWNELETTNFIEDTARVNPAIGETPRAYPVALALSRQVGDREQKIMITGDADCFSNERLGGLNSNFIMATFLWMSDGEMPVDVRRPATIDNALLATGADVKMTRRVLAIIFPSILLLSCLVLWIRRRGR